MKVDQPWNSPFFSGNNHRDVPWISARARPWPESCATRRKAWGSKSGPMASASYRTGATGGWNWERWRKENAPAKLKQQHVEMIFESPDFNGKLQISIESPAWKDQCRYFFGIYCMFFRIAGTSGRTFWCWMNSPPWVRQRKTSRWSGESSVGRSHRDLPTNFVSGYVGCKLTSLSL